MAFKNFSDESEADRGQPVLDGADTSLQAHAPPDNPLGTSDREASSAFDALALFLSEDAATASGTAATAIQDQRTSLHGAAAGGDRPGPAPPTYSPTVDDPRARLRQTEMDLERLKSDAAACSSDMRQLRDVAAELAQEYTRLTDAGRQTEKRAELAVETLTAIENRLGPIERLRELTRSTDDRLGSLAQLAEQVIGRAADFQVQKELIDHALVEATRVRQLLSALDARVATLAEHEQVFRHAEETVGHLERRAADAAADLERRVDDFQSRKRTIEQALNDATRAADLLSSLDARVAALTERDLALRNAAQTVGHLERRSAEVADRLEQAARMTSAIEHDLASLKKQLRTLDPGGLRPVVVRKELESHTRFGEPSTRTVTAGSLLPARVRVLTHALQRAGTALGDRRDRIRIRLRRVTRDMRPGGSQARSPIVHAFVRPSDNARAATPAVLPDLGAMAERAPQHLTTTRTALPILARAQKSRAPARLWVAVAGVLVVLLGLGVTRFRDDATPISSPERMAAGDLAAPAPVAALPGRPLGSGIFVMPESGPAAMISRGPTGDVPDDARPTKHLVRPPAVTALVTGASGVVPSAKRSATAPLPDTSPAQRFIGDLTVESLPSGAAVFIDQRDVGRTPVQVRRLRAGSHVIRIEHEGYERWTSTALVPADQQTRVRAKLQPDCCPELRRISY